MNEEDILQIIGIIFMASGSILAIKGLWEHKIERTIEKTKLDTDMLIKSSAIMIRANKWMNEHLEIDESEKNQREAILYLIILPFIILSCAVNELKCQILRKIKRYLIYSGITLIIIGAIIQTIGIWL